MIDDREINVKALLQCRTETPTRVVHVRAAPCLCSLCTTTHAARLGLTRARGTAEREGATTSFPLFPHSAQGKSPRYSTDYGMYCPCKFSLVCERISCMCMPARRRALLVEPSAPPPNIALLALEDNQSNAKALEPTVFSVHHTKGML